MLFIICFIVPTQNNNDSCFCCRVRLVATFHHLHRVPVGQHRGKIVVTTSKTHQTVSNPQCHPFSFLDIYIIYLCNAINHPIIINIFIFLFALK